MKSRIVRIAAIVIVVQLLIGTSVANAFDDDFLKLQEQQFKLQRQLMDQQFKLQRQLMDQQFQMQRQLWRLESYNRNLSSYSPPSHWHVGASSFDPMINLRSQIRMQDYNINSLTNISNRDLIKLQNQQFRIQQPMRQTFKDQQQLSKIIQFFIDIYNGSLTAKIFNKESQLMSHFSKENSIKFSK